MMEEDEQEIARLQARLKPLRWRAGEVPLPRRARATWRIGASIALAASSVIAVVWLSRGPARPALPVVALAGASFLPRSRRAFSFPSSSWA